MADGIQHKTEIKNLNSTSFALEFCFFLTGNFELPFVFHPQDSEPLEFTITLLGKFSEDVFEFRFR